MNFLVDAQLLRRMVDWFRAARSDAIHTLDLPLGNQTTDQDVTHVADLEQRVLITKDGDFVDSHLLSGEPAKLLLISTGNISNRELERLVVPLIPAVVSGFLSHSFLEVSQSGVFIRG